MARDRSKTETRHDLSETLGAMGMPLAFDPAEADFSAITTQERLYIAAVVHQATISVDDTGAKATAATAIVMAGVTATPAKTILHVDRPFVFAVRDTSTGALPFLGRIVDPTA